MARSKRSYNKNQGPAQAEAPAASAPATPSWLNRFSKEDRICFIGLLLLVFIVVVIRSKFLSIPYERDEGAYSYYGKLLLEGKIPYKDFYEQKLPGIFYFF